MKKIIFIIILFISSIYSRYLGTAGLLLISPGAEAAGMGEAMVAYPNTPMMSYYNPAALSFLAGHSLSISRNKWLPSMNITNVDNYHTFAAFRYKPKPSIKYTFGANINYFKFPDYLLFKAFSFNFAYKILKSSSIAFTIKNVNQEFIISEELQNWYVEKEKVSNNFLYDISCFIQLPKSNLGLHVANIGKPISILDNTLPAPTNISIGSYHQLYNDGYNKYMLSLQIDKLWVERNSVDDIKYKFGIEYKYTDAFILRTGYIVDKYSYLDKYLTFGLGIRLLQYGFDFGYTRIKNSPRNKTKYFTVFYNF